MAGSLRSENIKILPLVFPFSTIIIISFSFSFFVLLFFSFPFGIQSCSIFFFLKFCL